MMRKWPAIPMAVFGMVLSLSVATADQPDIIPKQPDPAIFQTMLGVLLVTRPSEVSICGILKPYATTASETDATPCSSGAAIYSDLCAVASLHAADICTAFCLPFKKTIDRAEVDCEGIAMSAMEAYLPKDQQCTEDSGANVYTCQVGTVCVCDP